METKIIYDDSINQDLIKNLSVSVIGFGSQGHAHALNLHESGVNVTVGLREDSKSATRARDMGGMTPLYHRLWDNYTCRIYDNDHTIPHDTPAACNNL